MLTDRIALGPPKVASCLNHPRHFGLSRIKSGGRVNSASNADKEVEKDEDDDDDPEGILDAAIVLEVNGGGLNIARRDCREDSCRKATACAGNFAAAASEEVGDSALPPSSGITVALKANCVGTKRLGFGNPTVDGKSFRAAVSSWQLDNKSSMGTVP